MTKRHLGRVGRTGSAAGKNIDFFVPRGYIDGFTLTRDASDTAHNLNIGAGWCADSTGTVIMNHSEITKDIEPLTGWVEGDENDGLANALTLDADTWYHVFVIAKISGQTDAGFDTSLTAANLLTDASDYIYYRRVGSVLLDSSANLTDFVQDGDWFSWVTPTKDIDQDAIGTDAVTVTARTPNGVRTQASMVASFSQHLYISDLSTTDLDPNQTQPITSGTQISPNHRYNSHLSVWTNTSSQFRIRAVLDQDVEMFTAGWMDLRGKDA